MPRYKLTLGLQKSVYSPTESYISADLSGGAATAAFQRLLDKRLACVSSQVDMIGVRFAQVQSDPNAIGDVRRSKLYPAGSWPVIKDAGNVNIQIGGALIPGEDTNPDQARAAMQVNLTFDTDRTSYKYWMFPPDAIMVGEPLGVDMKQSPGYQALFDSFINTLINDGWSIRARRRDTGFSQVPIKAWVASSTSPTNVGIKLADSPPSGILQNDTVIIKNVRRRGTDKTSYNGKYKVALVVPNPSDNTVIYYLQGTETGDPSSVKLNGTVQKIGYAYFPITGGLALRSVVHSRGNSFGSRRGKHRKKVSLDF